MSCQAGRERGWGGLGRADQLGGLRTGVRPVPLVTTRKMVCDFSGMLVQPHKAIVGANAFAHESGIHQDGMLKSKATYEIITPEEIGLVRVDDAGIVLGARPASGGPCTCPHSPHTSFVIMLPVEKWRPDLVLARHSAPVSTRTLFNIKWSLALIPCLCSASSA